jgi:predicted nucleic acid-binding protein
LTALVIDASAALHLVAASAAAGGSRAEWHAPRLLRSELLSALHAQVRRGVVPSGAAQQMIRHFDGLDVTLFSDERRLHERAWTLADELGWAKTYDAEYVALADILGLPLLTVDGRLARGVGHLVTVVGPVDVGL